MKIAEIILIIFTIILVLVSSLYIGISISDFYGLEIENRTFDSFYGLLGKYSGVHKFTFVVLASYLGLRRLRLSFESNQKTLSQMKLTEDEVFRKREVETNTLTLQQCEKYLNEIQSQYKELIQKESYSGMPTKWDKLHKVERKSLELAYPRIYKKLCASESELKGESLLTLYKLEAFSATFLKGNCDLELGRKIIGHVFTKQTGYLIGIIAYYQAEGNENLFKNTLDLRKTWGEKTV